MTDQTLVSPSELSAPPERSIDFAAGWERVPGTGRTPDRAPLAAAGSAAIRMSADPRAAPAADEPTAELSAPAGTVSRADIGGIAPSCGDDKACGCGGAKTGDCGCGCGGAKQKPQLVFALGTVGIDFPTEAGRDSFIQAMKGENPFDHQKLVDFLDDRPFEAPSLIWTLNIDMTPIYAIQPAGAYAEHGYELLRKCLIAQLAKDLNHAEIVSIPGMIVGQTRLMSGQIVPVIVPALRGIYAWNVDALVKQIFRAPKTAEERKTHERDVATLGNFLNRVYFELRNLGVSGPDRALNFAATDASKVAAVIEKATKMSLELDRLSVSRSPICRADSECYDVELSFFNPNNMNVANRVFRFTVDVSDVIPVSLHQVRDWARRA